MLQSVDARTGTAQGTAWNESTLAQIEAAANSAGQVADAFAATSAATRAALLRALADAAEAERAELVQLADLETGLGTARLEGEFDRTTFQLRGFADVLEKGGAHDFLDEPAIPGAPPKGRPRMTRVRVPIGPVAMFSASNFPFAFSVLGGDTASALAAGCPVVVKAHPAHPKLSRQVAQLAQKAVAALGLPAGVFQFVEGGSIEVGVRLVQAEAISAVAFTGSFKGGTALAKLAAERPRPIPFYGELGSINPLVVLPAALEKDAAALAQTLATSICTGAGQFCTSPGVIVVLKGEAGDAFVQSLVTAIEVMTPHAMLTAGIREAFERGVKRWRSHGKLTPLVAEPTTDTPNQTPRPFLAEVQAHDFIADHELREEVFGSAALVVRADSVSEAKALLHAVGGTLTVTLWGVPSGTELPDAETLALVRMASQVAGRVLFSGVPTGVAVTAAQHHGGPFPASTTPFTTSVGYAALERFLRPVALQDAPQWLVAREGVPA